MTLSPQSVGVGLRHEHYYDAIDTPADIDFVEVHAENLFMQGGIVKDIMHKARHHYALSIHATSLGLGSVTAPSDHVLEQLKQLADEFSPELLSDHACFNRAYVHGKQIHTGDLLPLRYNTESLDILARHVDKAQVTLQRPLLIENLSIYIEQPSNSLSEFAFLARLSEKTGCKLLLDLNNILVNQYNRFIMAGEPFPAFDITMALDEIAPIKADMIGEIHLAGTTPAAPAKLMIDDHARTVSDSCWALYQAVIEAYGPAPTLIEWDQNLPAWETLVSLAQHAKSIQQQVLI
ncbi:DUF692 domain-containing protein [Alteromonas sediminis]|uniref:DUF692 domain-containing protein n=1 Tax=Alteromonas sediminis TaxID=2259342 RepID=A0A3N5Y1K2_9ALTE|nr:DUF692 domain-containing protein [Alteromonas sediminis]RPJ67532.1 DUF692 domain-containing protein [Alteromonas sediminis]